MRTTRTALARPEHILMEDQHTAIALAPPSSTIVTEVAMVAQAPVTAAQALVTAGPAQAQVETTTLEAEMVVTATPVAEAEVTAAQAQALETTTAPETAVTSQTATPVHSMTLLVPLTCANPSSTPTNTKAPSKPKPRSWSHSRPCA